MKRLVILFISSILLIQCQVLKEPAGKVMSVSLPTPEIDTLAARENNYPPADFNLQVTNLKGEQVNMEAYRGKVIFLNFWATWCMPCVAELPSINKLYEQFKEENIVFLLISSEAPEKVQHYKDKKKFEVPFMIQSNTSHIPKMYYSPGIPTTFIINKEGELVRASSGAEDWDDKEFVEILKKML